MFILHITCTVFKAHARTVCKRSKQTTIDTLLDTDNLNKNRKRSTITYLEDTGWWSMTSIIMYIQGIYPLRKAQKVHRHTQGSAEEI